MRNVYLAQVNNLFGASCFLPYSVGMLWAYAKSIPEIAAEYELKEFLFVREPITDVVKRMDKPDVLGISLYCWNARYSLALAKVVKEAFPKCLVVAGGPMVPDDPRRFDTPFVDVCVQGEGEKVFTDILRFHSGNWTPNGSIRGERESDLDSLPSPYLTGVFDELLGLPYEFHASQETHRGCPYACTFLRLGQCHLSEGKTIRRRANPSGIRLVLAA